MFAQTSSSTPPDSEDSLGSAGVDIPESPNPAASCSYHPGGAQREAAFFSAYPEMFPDSLPSHHAGAVGVQHEIHLQPGAQPYARAQFRLSPAELTELQTQLKELILSNRVRRSASAWAAPILFVRKANGTLRMCVDYRGLNAVTTKDRQPLPRIDDLLDRLSGATCFSSLDLASGYWQVPVADEHRHLTAFMANGELWEWNVMPVGLTGAPATFQRRMLEALGPLRAFCCIYLDDILVFSNSPEEHAAHLAAVLKALKAKNLVACKPKCHLFRSELKFLGHIVGGGQLMVNPDKVRAVQQWPRPSTLKSLKGFLALAGWYRRFINDFAGITACLSALESPAKFQPILPDTLEDKAVLALKAALTSAPVLLIPDSAKPYTLRTDASLYRVAAELLQEGPEGELHPVSFYSRKLTPAERNYDPRSAELLAIYDALRHWRCYLEGSKFQLVVQTDHQSLQYFSTQQDLNRRETRWMSFFSQYDGLHFTYRPGPEQVVPDALSRLEEAGEASGPQVPYIPDPAAKEDPCQPVSAVLTPHAKDFQPWQATYSAMQVSKGDRQNRFLKWQYFNQLQELAGPLHVDAFCTPDGRNSHCPLYWSTEQDALQQAWASQHIWAHPPYEEHLLLSTVLKAEQSWMQAPWDTKVVLMVPLWSNTTWWARLQAAPWQLLHTYPEHTTLFLDHRGLPLPPTKWPVQAYLLAPSPPAAALHNLTLHQLQLCSLVTPKATEISSMLKAAQADPSYQSQLQAVSARPTSFPLHEARDGLLYYKQVLQVPSGPLGQALRQQIIWECHDCALSGHKGAEKTILTVRQRASTWEGLSKQVTDYVNSCPACQQAKRSTQLPAGHLHPLPPPSLPWQSCAMDWLTDLPVCKGGKDSILVVIDRFTKSVVLVPCCSTDPVTKTAQRYLKHVVRRFGVQESLLSDRDPKVVSAFWSELMTQLGTRLDMTTTAHQQANGQAEGQMKIISAALRALPLAERSSWLDILPHLEFAINNTPHSSTGLTPFMATHGFNPRLPVDLLTRPANTPKLTTAQQFVDRFQQLRQGARQALLEAQLRQKIAYDKRHRAVHFSLGDMVYVHAAAIPGLSKEERHLPHKLRTVWSGPYPIVACLPRDTYRLQLPSDLRLHPEFHVSKLKLHHSSGEFPREEPHSPPAWDTADEAAEWEVERVLRHRYLGGHSRRPPEFQIKWKGAPVAQASWRRYPDLQGCLPLVREYMHARGLDDALDRLHKHYTATLAP